jgi:uncharacterized protein DUF4124
MRNPSVLLMALLLASPVSAKLFKCQANGKTSYQDKPCLNDKGSELILREDISQDRHEAARQRLAAELEQREDKLRAEREQKYTERLIQAEEVKARASVESALQSERQADALEERNQIEQNKNNRPLYFLNLY